MIRDARPDEVELVRALFREYADGLGVDLGFQQFERELGELPANYVALLLAEVGGEVAGCAGVRQLEPGLAELKRLYVREGHRGRGLGRALSQAAIERARAAGFRAIRLDTLPTMTAAVALYRELGFREIGPYRHNPIEGTRFFELELRHVAPVSRAPARGHDPGVDVTRVAASGAQGTKGRLIEPAVSAVAARTRFDVQTLRAIVGAVFLLTALRTLVRAARTMLREARD